MRWPREVQPERWGWFVAYTDGTTLEQFASDGEFHQWAEVRQDELAVFVLYKLDDPTRRITVHVSPSTQVSYFYRNYILNAATPDEERVRVYVLVWEGCFYYILPDDQLLMSDKDIDIYG